jgi:hypothetical protein
LVEAVDARVSIHGICVGVEPPLEHGSRYVQRPGDDAFPGALVVRPRVDQ